MTTFNIGKGIELDVDVAKIMGHQAVVDGLVAFAIKQVLTNAHSAITTEIEPDEAKRREQSKAAAEKRLQAWYEGTFTSSERGPRTDAVGKIMRELGEQAIKANAPAYAMWKKLDAKAQRTVVDKMVAKNEAAFRKTAEERLAIKVDAPAPEDIMALFEVPAEKPAE